MQPAASGRRKRCEHVPGTWAEAFVQPGSTWGQAVVGAPEAVGGNRRAKDVATETLETQAIVFVHGDIGVQRVALEEGAARFGAGGVLGLEDALSRRRHDGFALCDGQGVGLFVGELALGGVLRDQPLDAAGDLPKPRPRRRWAARGRRRPEVRPLGRHRGGGVANAAAGTSQSDRRRRRRRRAVGSAGCDDKRRRKGSGGRRS